MYVIPCGRQLLPKELGRTSKIHLNTCCTSKPTHKKFSRKMNHIPLPALIGLAAVIVAGCLYYFLNIRPKQGLSDFDRLLGNTKPSKPNRPKSSNPQEVARLTQELSSRFFHDKEKVKSAVAYERERNPSGSEQELLRAAIYRWDRLSN